MTARGLVVFGMLLLIGALVAPGSLSSYVPLGLAFWVFALLLTFSRTYIHRAPMPGQGRLFEYKDHPIAYHSGFAMAVAIFGFICWILIRAYIND